LTQAELGDRIGEAQTTVSRWETGEVEIEFGQARRIEAALDLPTGWIGRAAGLVDVDALYEDDPSTFIRVGYFDNYEAARTEIDAAATLGLGVRVVNRMVPWGVDEVLVEEWVVTLYPDVEERR
jgi:transcriptional regulator with XRE-family HTH domain